MVRCFHVSWTLRDDIKGLVKCCLRSYHSFLVGFLVQHYFMEWMRSGFELELILLDASTTVEGFSGEKRKVLSLYVVQQGGLCSAGPSSLQVTVGCIIYMHKVPLSLFVFSCE